MAYGNNQGGKQYGNSRSNAAPAASTGGEEKKKSTATHDVVLVDGEGQIIKEFVKKLGKEVSVRLGSLWVSDKETGTPFPGVIFGIIGEGDQAQRFKAFPKTPKEEGQATPAQNSKPANAGGQRRGGSSRFDG